MNKHDLLCSIEKISNDNYLRYSTNENHEVLYGKNENKICFVIRGSTLRKNYKSSNIVTLQLELIGSTKYQLLYILENDIYLELFLDFFEDIIKCIENNTGNDLEISYQRWCLWKKMFNSSYMILNENRIQGLIGELYFLKDFMFKKYNMQDSLLSWGGPQFNKKDFEICKVWFEIKSTLNINGNIKISSLNQLDSNNQGYLAIVYLEKSTNTNDDAINLNKLVDIIINSIPTDQDKNIFINKLNGWGYSRDEQYNKYNYIKNEIKIYNINDKFPKLTINNVPKGIVEAEYEISLVYLSEYEVKL
jgi:hypothetical protein